MPNAAVDGADGSQSEGQPKEVFDDPKRNWPPTVGSTAQSLPGPFYGFNRSEAEPDEAIVETGGARA